MEGRDTTSDGAEAVVRCSLLALVLAAVTNAVVALVDAVEWAWWAAGAWGLLALLLAGAWAGPAGERAARRARPEQVRLVVGEAEPHVDHEWVSSFRAPPTGVER
ncbi:MAG TPA: hypothetical protein VNO31_38250 [Umezawaea sp.]|nr:hypothetical protein [Umezawaea sp.]